MKTIYSIISYGLICLYLLFFNPVLKAQTDGAVRQSKPVNPNEFRNYLTPTAFGLDKGEILYQNYLLFFQQFYFGLGDDFTVGLGFEVVSLLDSAASFPGVFINGKYSVPNAANFFSLAVGGVAVRVPESEIALDFGGFYLAGTLGDGNRNLTLGLGFGVFEGEFLPSPVIMFGSHYKIGKRIGLVTDNWFIPDIKGGFISLGGRRWGKKLSWDLALSAIIAEEGVFEFNRVPLLGLTIPLRGFSP